MRIEFTTASDTIHVEAHEATYASLAKIGALSISQRIVICTAPWMYDLSTRIFECLDTIPEPSIHYNTSNTITVPDFLIEFFNSLIPHYDYYLLLSYVIPISLAPHECSVAETLSNLKNIGCVNSNYCKNKPCSESYSNPRKYKNQSKNRKSKSKISVFAPIVNEKSSTLHTIGVKNQVKITNHLKTFRIIEHRNHNLKMSIDNLTLPEIIITPPVLPAISLEAKTSTMVP
jgi:hypothetical protein